MCGAQLPRCWPPSHAPPASTLAPPMFTPVAPMFTPVAPMFSPPAPTHSRLHLTRTCMATMRRQTLAPQRHVISPTPPQQTSAPPHTHIMPPPRHLHGHDAPAYVGHQVKGRLDGLDDKGLGCSLSFRLCAAILNKGPEDRGHGVCGGACVWRRVCGGGGMGLEVGGEEEGRGVCSTSVR